MALKIILVEDDRSIRTMLEYYFTSMGHQVLAYESGEELFAGQVQGDIALLDGMLPGMDGVDIVRRLRRDPVTAKMPIIMLTARQTEMDKVTALDSGADDYITKPFGVMELQARINAVIRRVGDREPQLVYGDLVIDPAGRTVRRGEEEISLTYKEFELLRLLVSRRGTVLTRDEILAAVWDYNFVGETRTVDMHIKSLRQKLGEGYITTVRSVGYKMV
ncbi:MAG TPA: DNA-binding response regulator [Clostridiales bacterium]|nr:DNA-binding response regulator [Clostridiales bacterium]